MKSIISYHINFVLNSRSKSCHLKETSDLFVTYVIENVHESFTVIIYFNLVVSVIPQSAPCKIHQPLVRAWIPILTCEKFPLPSSPRIL